MQDITRYIHRLHQDIFKVYIDSCSNYFAQNQDQESWFEQCQKTLSDFVSTRSGWSQNEQNGASLVFSNGNKISTRLKNGESTGELMIRVTEEIANAEMVDFSKKNNDELIKKIRACVEQEDWTIPFPRRRL